MAFSRARQGNVRMASRKAEDEEESSSSSSLNVSVFVSDWSSISICRSVSVSVDDWSSCLLLLVVGMVALCLLLAASTSAASNSTPAALRGRRGASVCVSDEGRVSVYTANNPQHNAVKRREDQRRKAVGGRLLL